MTDTATAASAGAITVREALRLFWETDHYPILGDADARDALELDREAIAKAAHAIPSPDDPPEFAQWLAALCDPRLTNDVREETLRALESFVHR